jgi:molybdenum cofactor cytidylyltransferase
MPQPDGSPFVTGLLLAAGGSRRLGRPKQLLAYRGATLLDHTAACARACEFDQLVIALGARSADIRARVDLHGATVVVNPGYERGCASSIVTALTVVDPRTDVLVLMLGDQPGVRPAAVHALLAGRGSAPVAACRYDDGRGHPLAFAGSMFDELRALRGDKAVWALLDGRDVAEVPVPGPVPLDVDTWEDYEAVLAGTGSGAGRHDRPRATAAS